MPAFLGLGPANPVTWCNFHRKGGLKSVLLTSGAYFLIVIALIFLSAGIDPRDASRAYGVWPGLLLGLQFLFVVVIGAGRVSTTIRGDLASGMIESLRMMPLPARHAVTGYLSAAAASLCGFFAANFFLGLIVTALAQLPPQRWLAANAILLAFALFIWTIAAFLAFLVKSAGAILVVVSLVGVFGNAGVLYVAPGIVVLAGPLIGSTIFSLRTAQTELATPLLVSVAAQFLVGAIFFAGAARKFRRPDALALGGSLSIALLLAIVAISLLAILRPEEFQPVFLSREFGRMDPNVPFCGSTVLAMFFALIPLANLARLHVNWSRGRIDDSDLRRAAPPLVPSAIMVTAILCLMVLALPSPPAFGRLACLFAALFGFSASVICAAAWVYRAIDNAKVVLAIWLTIYCLVPLTLDFARSRLVDRDEPGPVLATMASLSPIGMTIEVSSRAKVDLRPGAVFHLLIPLLPAALYLRTVRRQAAAHRPPPLAT
jgi:hypothetical protein